MFYFVLWGGKNQEVSTPEYFDGKVIDNCICFV